SPPCRHARPPWPGARRRGFLRRTAQRHPRPHRPPAGAGHGGHYADGAGGGDREPAPRRRAATVALPGGGAGQRPGQGRRILPRARDPGGGVSAGDLTALTVNEASRLLRDGSISASELVNAHVERIGRLDDKVQAYLRPTQHLRKLQTEEADRRLRAGDAPPLAGIPIAIKDVLCV